MPKTQAQKLAQQKYRENTVEQIAIEVKKGQRGEWRQAANIRGLSLTSLIKNGVDEYIQNHPPIKKE